MNLNIMNMYIIIFVKFITEKNKILERIPGTPV